MADALSRKTRATVASLAIQEWGNMGIVNEFDLEMEELEDRLALFTVTAEPTMVSRVVEAQRTDSESDAIR
ncbi:hypothetical protein, partial [Bartonella sp. OT172YNZD]|uniref:hypothetical protein n=1 Tax=Bartonella sp. OT172YNZD TaxID=3243572 RepID=UPI0035CF5BCA